MVAGCFCQRKAVLEERFKGMDRGNQVMLVGTIVHQLFQEVVQRTQRGSTHSGGNGSSMQNATTKKNSTTCMKKGAVMSASELDQLLVQLLQQASVVRDMYSLGITQATLHQEIKNFLPHIHAWIAKYMVNGNRLYTSDPKDWRGIYISLIIFNI